MTRLPDPTASLKALRQLEDDFHATEHMLGITYDRVEDMISRPPDLVTDGGSMYQISGENRDRTLFSAGDALDRFVLLRTKVFAILFPGGTTPTA